jgi:hypothetical protein
LCLDGGSFTLLRCGEARLNALHGGLRRDHQPAWGQAVVASRDAVVAARLVKMRPSGPRPHLGNDLWHQRGVPGMRVITPRVARVAAVSSGERVLLRPATWALGNSPMRPSRPQPAPAKSGDPRNGHPNFGAPRAHHYRSTPAGLKRPAARLADGRWKSRGAVNGARIAHPDQASVYDHTGNKPQMIPAFHMDRCHVYPSPESSRVFFRSIRRKVKDVVSFFTCSISAS